MFSFGPVAFRPITRFFFIKPDATLHKVQSSKMATRSNLYKNPSITYKKDLSLSSVLQNLKGMHHFNPSFPFLSHPPNAFFFSFSKLNFLYFQLTTSPPEMLRRLKNIHQPPMSERHVVNASAIQNHRLLSLVAGTVKLKSTTDLCLTRIT